MRIEAKDTIKSHGLIVAADDIITVPDAVGENWVANGWAKNADTGEDNAPSDKPVTLAVDNIALGLSDNLEGK